MCLGILKCVEWKVLCLSKIWVIMALHNFLLSTNWFTIPVVGRDSAVVSSFLQFRIHVCPFCLDGLLISMTREPNLNCWEEKCKVNTNSFDLSLNLPQWWHLSEMYNKKNPTPQDYQCLRPTKRSNGSFLSDTIVRNMPWIMSLYK